MASKGGNQVDTIRVRRIPIPANLLGPALSGIHDLTELKLLLRAAALLADQPVRGGVPPSVSLDELVDDSVLQTAGHDADLIVTEPDAVLRGALAANLRGGTLLAVRQVTQVRIFFDDPDARRYVTDSGLERLAPEDIAPGRSGTTAPHFQPPLRPVGRSGNIYALYEKHIGTFNHNIGEQLLAAEEEFPPAWIEDAFALAADNNARSWQYVIAILRRWLQEGRAADAAVANPPRDKNHEHGKPGRDTAPDSRTGYLESYQRRYGRLPWEPATPAGGTGG